jgi:hypothetical protein
LHRPISVFDDPFQTSDAWTYAEKLLTVGLRALGAGLAMKRREFITLVGGQGLDPYGRSPPVRNSIEENVLDVPAFQRRKAN